MSNFIAEQSQVRSDSRSVVSSWLKGKKSVSRDTSSIQSNEIPNLSLRIFLNPYSPWVLVKDGSFMGYFDWIPIHLRVGPWHSNSMVVMIALAVALFLYRPGCESLFQKITNETMTMNNIYKDNLDNLWYCSVFLCIFMFILFIIMCLIRTPGIIATFTIQSWLMNAMRFGIQTFLTPNRISHLPPTINHGLIHLHNLLRYPAFATASITFFWWNFFISPYIYLWALPTSTKRRNFLQWNFSFFLVQIHVCNILYSFINVFLTDALVSRYSSSTFLAYYQPIKKVDLWMSFLFLFLYTLFYYLFLDRLGLHIYGPLFTPRNKVTSLIWLAMYFMIFLIFTMSNRCIERILNNQRLASSVEWENIYVYGPIKISGVACVLAVIFSFLIRRLFVSINSTSTTVNQR